MGEEMAQPGEEIVNGFDNEQGAVAVLNISRVNLGADQEANRIGDDMALAAPSLRWGRLLTFLPASYPRAAPRPVVLTDALSVSPPQGLASRHATSPGYTNHYALLR